MLACISQASADYQVPVAAIVQVIKAAQKTKGIGPMGIPVQWLPVLQTYGFQPGIVQKNPCWGIAAGTWILAVEKMYAGNSPYSNESVRPFYPSHLPMIPVRVISYAQEAARLTGVPANILLAVAAQESGFNPNAVSPTGAQGLMQFEPGTWAHYGSGSPFNPQNAMIAGAKYLRHLALEFHSWPLAIAGYNAGGQAVRNAGYKIPPFSQTQHYVPAVLGYYQKFFKMGLNH